MNSSKKIEVLYFIPCYYVVYMELVVIHYGHAKLEQSILCYRAIPRPDEGLYKLV